MTALQHKKPDIRKVEEESDVNLLRVGNAEIHFVRAASASQKAQAYVHRRCLTAVRPLHRYETAPG